MSSYNLTKFQIDTILLTPFKQVLTGKGASQRQLYYLNLKKW